jgi:hypothetical protein
MNRPPAIADPHRQLWHKVRPGRSVGRLAVLSAVMATATFAFLSLLDPVYRSEARVLIAGAPVAEVGNADAAASGQGPYAPPISSQLALIRSDDIARRVAAELDLASVPEYRAAARGSFVGRLLAGFGLARNLVDLSAEDRVLAHFDDRLRVQQVGRSREIAIDFAASDPGLAADGANAVANAYLALLATARQGAAGGGRRELASASAGLDAGLAGIGSGKGFAWRNWLFEGGPLATDPAVADEARLVEAASVPAEPDFPKRIPMTIAATVAMLVLAIGFILIRERARRGRLAEVAAAPMPAIPGDRLALGGHLRWADDHAIRRMMPGEPTLVPVMESEVERSLAVIAERIVREGHGRIVVTLVEGSDVRGRPLAAVALARALAHLDRRGVLLDLRDDDADSINMGRGGGMPGFTDLCAGEASFAQVIFRDRRSRAHFIPAGRKLPAARMDAEMVEAVLSALDHTYDHVIVDAGEETIGLTMPSATAAVVVSEFAAADPRTVRAFERISRASPAAIMLLVVDAVPEAQSALPAAAATAEAAA